VIPRYPVTVHVMHAGLAIGHVRAAAVGGLVQGEIAADQQNDAERHTDRRPFADIRRVGPRTC
jgi:hypothetical protein